MWTYVYKFHFFGFDNTVEHKETSEVVSYQYNFSLETVNWLVTMDSIDFVTSGYVKNSKKIGLFCLQSMLWLNKLLVVFINKSYRILLHLHYGDPAIVVEI